MIRLGYELGPFINPDVIAKGLSGPEPARNLQAGRLTLERVNQLIENREAFSRESTLSGREIVTSMRRAKEAGFRVRLIYVAVSDVETAIARVRDRVIKGGHDIPEPVQRRRFDKSLKNAAEIAPDLDEVLLFYNGDRGHAPMATIHDGVIVHLTQPHPAWVNTIVSGLPRGAVRGA